MKLKKFSMLILASSLIVSNLAGCASNKKAEADTNSTPTEEVTTSEDGRPMIGNMYVDGQLPLVKEKETLKIATVSDVDPNLKLLVQELEEKTNVHIEWDYYPVATWPEKKSLLFAADDLPDAFMGGGPSILTDQEVINYGSQGLLIPLNEYLNEETMRNVYNDIAVEHPDLMAQVTMPDGNIYSLPSYDYGIVTTTNEPLYINKTWLDNLGLEVPKTTDEFYAVLKAFKEEDANQNGDPTDEIPYTFKTHNLDLFSSFGAPDSPSHLGYKDGKVYYTAAQPEYKEAIKYFNKLYSEGLIDPEAFTQDGPMFNAKWKDGEDGSKPRIVGAFQTWRSNGAADYVAIEPLVGPTGVQAWPERPVGFQETCAFAITKSASNPMLVALWADQLYEQDFAIQQTLSYKIGTHMELEEGKFKLIQTPDLTKEPDKSTFLGNGNKVGANVSKSNGERMFVPPHMVEKQELDLLYKDYYLNKNMPKVSYTLEESQTLADYQLDINGYVDKMYAKWVMSGGVEEEWDGYLQKLDSMGIDKMLEINQAAVDRYNEVMNNK